MVDRPGTGPVVPQRATLIVSTTGRFHSRVYRIARGLVDRGHEVTVIARWAPGLPRDEVHPAGYRIRRISVSPLEVVPVIGYLLSRRRREVPPTDRVGPHTPTRRPPRLPGPLHAARQTLAPFARPITIRALTKAAARVAPRSDLYHAVVYTRIPIALALGRRDTARVVYDAADIYMDSGELARVHRLGRWFLARWERRSARAADLVVTVSDAYARVLEERFGVRYPPVIMNCSYRYTPPEPREHRFHDLLGLSPDQRVVLYHGNFFPHRGIEQLVHAITRVPRGVLVLMGEGPLESDLRAAQGRGDSSAVRVIRPVPPEELLDWVASADLVAVPIQPSTLNHRLTTPNKLFEAMAAGVPVVASDLPGMAPIVRDARSGVLVDATDIQALAAAIRHVLDAPEPVMRDDRQRAVEAAHDRYNWESQLDRLLDEYTALTGRRW